LKYISYLISDIPTLALSQLKDYTFKMSVGVLLLIGLSKKILANKLALNLFLLRAKIEITFY